MEWIGLVKDGDKWRTLANTLLNLRVPYSGGTTLTSRTVLSGVNWLVYVSCMNMPSVSGIFWLKAHTELLVSDKQHVTRLVCFIPEVSRQVKIMSR